MKKLAAVLLLVLVGCAFSPTGERIPIDTPAKQLVAVDAAFTAAVNAAVDAVNTGVLDPQSNAGRTVGGAIMAGSQAIVAAHEALRVGNMDLFIAKLSIAQSAIAAIKQVILMSQGDPT